MAIQPTQLAPVFGILQEACAFASTPLEEGALKLQLGESREDLCLQICDVICVVQACDLPAGLAHAGVDTCNCFSLILKIIKGSLMM